MEINPQVQERVKQTLRSEGMIPAIKLVRELTGLGLKEARDVVIAINLGIEIPPISTGAAGTGVQSEPEMPQQIVDLIVRGEKISAVKAYREMYSVDLKAAKDRVEAMEARLAKLPGAMSPSQDPAVQVSRGCFSFLACSAFVLGSIVLGLFAAT